MDTELEQAIRNDDDRTVESLLKRGETLNIEFKRETSNSKTFNWTPLTYCCYYGYHKTARVLVKHGALPNLRDKDGYFPLIAACGKKGHKECLRLLLNCDDIKVNGKSERGNTALHSAVRQNKQLCVEMLLEHPDTKLDVVNNNGETVFDVCKSEDILNLLRKKEKESNNNIEKKRMEMQKINEELKAMEKREVDKKIRDAENNLKDFEAKFRDLEQERRIIEDEWAKMEIIRPVLNAELNELRRQRENLVREQNNAGTKDTSWADCPICFEVMVLPRVIYQCREGHCICSDCRPRVDLCPVCKVDMINFASRNRALEQLICEQFN